MTSISLAPVFDIARVLLMTLVPISLVLLAQQRILTPLYGSYPALYHLNTVAFIAISASALSPFRARKSWNWLAAGFLLTVAPNASYWVAVWTARKGWILLGPALVHAAVVAPLLFHEHSGSGMYNNLMMVVTLLKNLSLELPHITNFLKQVQHTSSLNF